MTQPPSLGDDSSTGTTNMPSFPGSRAAAGGGGTERFEQDAPPAVALSAVLAWRRGLGLGYGYQSPSRNLEMLLY